MNQQLIHKVLPNLFIFHSIMNYVLICLVVLISMRIIDGNQMDYGSFSNQFLLFIFISSSFQVGPKTNRSQTQCFSTHLTTFASLFLPLQSSIIDLYSQIFKDFSQNPNQFSVFSRKNSSLNLFIQNCTNITTDIQCHTSHQLDSLSQLT